MDKLLQMIFHRLLGHVMKRGISAGITHVAGGGKPKSEMTPEERTQAQSAKDTAKRARQAANIARRMMR